jgi:hypothetical protein
MSDADCTIFDCPQCQSKRAGVIRSDPPRAKCADCGTTYDIATLPPTTDPDHINPLKLGRGKDKQKRKARPGVRHRRDNGPQELEVTPVPPPPPSQLGTLHVHTEDIIDSGPAVLLATHRRASKLSVKYCEELKDQWRLKTKWIQQLQATHRGRVRANYAMRWRPTFLAVVALSHSTMLGCKAANVDPHTAIDHRREDPDFEAQVLAAQDHCIDLLHAVTMRSAIEGDVEPVFWQGIVVGHIKKFDNRLRIELLRAHMPNKFKTPGSHAPVISGDNNKVIVIDAAKRAELVALRQEALEAMNPPLKEVRQMADLSDSSNSPGGVQ